MVAINESCLVFDGKLVINSKFCTNDENIRAAGPLTKYARRYYCENWTHSNFNSKEIGSKLADSMLELFDPTLEGVVDDIQAENYLVPKTVYCQLPGMSYDNSYYLLCHFDCHCNHDTCCRRKHLLCHYRSTL